MPKMKIKNEIEIDVCDDCRKPFGGEVHPFGGGEYCSNCWREPTPDMRMHAEAIYRGLQQEPRDTLKEFMSGFAVVYKSATGVYTASLAADKVLAEQLAITNYLHDSVLIDIFDKGVALYASVFVEVRYAAQTNTVSEEKLPLDLEVAKSTNRCRLCGKNINESGHCGIQLEFGREFAHKDCWTNAMKPVHGDMIRTAELLSDVVKSGARDTVKNMVRMLDECGYKIVKKEGA